MMFTLRVAVIGTGGVGGYYGGMLARAGEDVAFLARGAHLDAILSKGLKVKTSHAGEFCVHAKATDDPGEIGPVDLVLFCVKTYDTYTVVQLILPNICPETIVMSLQNGVEISEDFVDSLRRIVYAVPPTTRRLCTMIWKPAGDWNWKT